jgi:hypothetical protein
MLFGKKEEKVSLPDLPSSRSPFGALQSPSADVDNSDDSLPPFPAFPDEPSNEMNSLPSRKDSSIGVSNSSFPSPPNAKVVEMKEWQPTTREAPADYQVEQNHPELEEVEEEEESNFIPAPPVRQRFQSPPQRVARERESSAPPSDVFVRIDKFHASRKALSEVREQLQDIDELVKRIRETKLREEQELSAWEKDIVHIKGRVQTVLDNIFEKVD